MQSLTSTCPTPRAHSKQTFDLLAGCQTPDNRWLISANSIILQFGSANCVRAESQPHVRSLRPTTIKWNATYQGSTAGALDE